MSKKGFQRFPHLSNSVLPVFLPHSFRAFETQMTRMEADFVQREAPPSYGQLIAQGLIPPVEDFPVYNPTQVTDSHTLMHSGSSADRNKRNFFLCHPLHPGFSAAESAAGDAQTDKASLNSPFHRLFIQTASRASVEPTVPQWRTCQRPRPTAGSPWTHTGHPRAPQLPDCWGAGPSGQGHVWRCAGG